VSATHAPDRFTTLPDEQTLAATVVALEEHGFSVEVVDDMDGAREAVITRIPEGSSVMTNTSVTLQETGIADTIDGGGPYESARNRVRVGKILEIHQEDPGRIHVVLIRQQIGF
jgi:hypothetical protein